MSVTISTKVPEELAERIEEEREEGESKSATMRRLVRDGLDDRDTHYRLPPHLYAAWFGAALFLVPLLDAGDTSGAVVMGAGATLFVGGMAYEFLQ